MTLALELGGVHDPATRRALEQLSLQFPVVAAGGGGGAPSGPAGGVLSGTYPSPGFAVDMATQAELDAHTGLTTTAHGGIVASTDARLTDARTPTAHATTHQPGGSDAMAVDAAAATGSLRTIGTTATSAAAGNRGLPAAGTTGQVLAKNSATDYDAAWVAAGGSPATVLTRYETVMRAITLVPTQGAGGTVLASPFGGSVAGVAGGGTAIFAFTLDPADLAFAGTTNKMRLRTVLVTNAVAPTGTWTLGMNPVATFGGASAAPPTIATIGALTLSNSYAAPAATSSVTTTGADINFPAAGKYVFTVGLSAAMAANSQATAIFELQARQV